MKPVNCTLVIGWISFLNRRSIRFDTTQTLVNMCLFRGMMSFAKIVLMDVKKRSLREPDQDRASHRYCTETMHPASA